MAPISCLMMLLIPQLYGFSLSSGDGPIGVDYVQVEYIDETQGEMLPEHGQLGGLTSNGGPTSIPI